MSTFHIGLCSLPAVDLEPGQKCGVIRIGDFQEHFVMDVSYWDERRYLQQWRAAIFQVLTGERSALITSIGRPEGDAAVRWWAMYRVHDAISLTEQLRFRDQLPLDFTENSIAQFVAPRETRADDGRRISEWTTSVEALRRFLLEAPDAP